MAKLPDARSYARSLDRCNVLIADLDDAIADLWVESDFGSKPVPGAARLEILSLETLLQIANDEHDERYERSLANYEGNLDGFFFQVDKLAKPPRPHTKNGEIVHALRVACREVLSMCQRGEKPTEALLSAAARYENYREFDERLRYQLEPPASK